MKLKLTQKTRKRLILLTVVLEVILAALVIYGIYSGTLRSSLAGGIVMILLLLIPVLLVALLIAVVYGRRRPESTTDEPPTTDPLPADDGTTRFCMLTRIEENRHRYGHPRYDGSITLDRFCEDFRNYAAYQLKLS